MARIESFLSARLFLVPQVVGDRLYFISNLSGRNSLYSMKLGGSIPEPLLPPDIALQNPHLMPGASFVVFPKLDQILVMIDQDGNEDYQPMIIPMDGGYPEPAFGDAFQGYTVSAGEGDLEDNTIHFVAESRQEPLNKTYRANLETRELVLIGQGKYGPYPQGVNDDKTKYILSEQFGAGDSVLYRFDEGDENPRLLYGVPLQERQPDQEIAPTAIGECHYTTDENGVIFTTILFEDTYGIAYMRFEDPEDIKPVTITGELHHGNGEMESLEHLKDNRYLIRYNIDGCTWLYEGAYDEATLTMNLEFLLVGQEELSGGVLESVRYDEEGDRYALSFSTATSPTQLYTIEGVERDQMQRHTDERLLGISTELLSSGEDASFHSYDDLRISARMYLPAQSLGFSGPRPLVYYIHGGPQSQERPDFAWFSMPLIQFLTLNGFAVFVPNVRGSTGYGFVYMNRVVKDWGGDDRLDHVHAMTEVLSKDSRVDTTRAGVVGRSYGGYMTLTLAGRHHELWSAAADMFGPYDLLTFADRVPETWKPYIALLMGDPETEKEFMIERSPRTYIDQISCPLLVIQGKNDPRVKEVESRELVDHLRDIGKEVEYLMFENEGHDVLKFENRVRCYNAITDFFKEQLKP